MSFNKIISDLQNIFGDQKKEMIESRTRKREMQKRTHACHVLWQNESEIIKIVLGNRQTFYNSRALFCFYHLHNCFIIYYYSTLQYLINYINTPLLNLFAQYILINASMQLKI